MVDVFQRLFGILIWYPQFAQNTFVSLYWDTDVSQRCAVTCVYRRRHRRSTSTIQFRRFSTVNSLWVCGAGTFGPSIFSTKICSSAPFFPTGICALNRRGNLDVQVPAQVRREIIPGTNAKKSSGFFPIPTISHLRVFSDPENKILLSLPQLVGLHSRCSRWIWATRLGSI